MTSPMYPVKYTGPDVQCANFVIRPRRPTTADYRQPENAKLYRLTCVWQVGKNPSTGVEGELWMLSTIIANIATWVMISGGNVGTVVSVTGDDGIVTLPDGVGDIDLFGNVVGNATHPKPLFIATGGANTEQWDIQLTTAVPATPLDANDAGIASFNNAHFAVDPTSGMVSLTHPATVLTESGSTGGPIPPDVAGNIAHLGSNNTGGIVTVSSANQIDYSVYRWVPPATLNWTPIVRGSGAAGVGTYIKQNGVFSRIGNTVWFNFDIEYTAHTGTGNMQITGLPYQFAFANTNYPYALFTELVTLPVGFVTPFFIGVNAQTFGTCYVSRNTATKAPIQMANVQSVLSCFGYYSTDDPV